MPSRSLRRASPQAALFTDPKPMSQESGPPPAAIRLLRPGDLLRLQEIREAAFAPVFASFREIQGETVARHALAGAEAEQAALLSELCNPRSPAVVLIGEAEDRVVGFVSYTIKTERQFGEIGLNAVDPDVAGQGIGTQLYREALGRMKAEGVKVVEVGTGGDPSHAPARRAYQKVGFTRAIPSLSMYCQL